MTSTGGNDFNHLQLTPENKLSEVIGIALGRASVCWEPKPTGIFDSTTASQLVDEVIDWINTNVNKEGNPV